MNFLNKVAFVSALIVLLAGCTKDQKIWETNGAYENRTVWESNGKGPKAPKTIWKNSKGEDVLSDSAE